MMEMRQETDYVPHHIQKIIAFFLAMRAFTDTMRRAGHQFIYLQLDDPENRQNLPANLSHLIEQHQFSRFEYLLPDEYRLDEQLQTFCQGLPIPWAVADTEHFLTERLFLRQFFKGKKIYLMESFYRQMRKQTGLLMEGPEPVGGRWNFDSENRKKYDGKVPVPPLPSLASAQRMQEVAHIAALIDRQGVRTIGQVEPKAFEWPVTRAEALQVLEHFLRFGLPFFGAYQDAMDTRHPWLFHSRISFALNSKLLHPAEVVERAVAQWQAHPGLITLPQIEGFVRQIIGWREYVRGIYWDQMPGYQEKNFFDHQRSLPVWYWTGNTKMRCLQDAIGNSLQHGYAHHIQRLMVTGNFALLAGIHPDEVDQWYLGIYLDAIEWVEITNTRGMSQFADGGIVGTKPYVSSANYLDKMSNYCKQCSYDKSKRYGANACPFNSLYWHFYDRHRERLEKNPRIGMMYVTLNKMEPSEREHILQQAEQYLSQLDQL